MVLCLSFINICRQLNLFMLQMVELWKNPSGDVKLTSVPTKGPSGSNSEDSAKTAELKNTIVSLRTEIESVSRTVQCQKWYENKFSNVVYTQHHPLRNKLSLLCCSLFGYANTDSTSDVIFLCPRQ